MEPYRLLQNFIFIIILNSIPLGSSQDWCPSDCTCTVIPRTNQNHAKCTSLNGLLESKNLPIHSLDLSHANLTKINHLDKLRALTTIDLSYNKLSDIGHLGPRVKHINLKHNKITSAKLVNIPGTVVDLDVSFNEITYLPLELSKLNLTKIELFGNKLNCTCDTLEVRNHLVKNSVFTSYPVKCTHPIELKGTLWLQIKQDLYCKKETDKDDENVDEMKKINDDNENELMLGDAPITDGSEEKDKDEELGKDYMPINTNTDEVIDENVEGSGLSHLPMQNEHDKDQESSTATENKSNEVIDPMDEENDEDGSGSGMGISHIPLIENTSDESNVNSTELSEVDDVTFVETEKSDSEESTPIPVPTDDFFSTENTSLSFGLGIFGSGKSEETSETITQEDTTEEEEVTEEPIIPDLVSVLENENNDDDNVDVLLPAETDSHKDDMIQADIDKAEAGESNSTYILLGTVLIILICLLMYVGLKKMITKRKRNERDAERASELVDMDKKNLGKPLQKNGHEQKPLITNDNSKPTTNGKKPGYSDSDPKTQEPLLNGHRKDPHDDESNNNLTKPQEQSNNIPVPEPRQSLQQQSPQQTSPPKVHSPRFGSYPPPKSPRSPTSGDTSDSKSPSSPKTGRYSPVYSPETGKVKIKLTEVPKPKTPMLVTRSRSNAGDIVTTPTSDVVDSGVKSNENK
ncbi:protein windpipe [Condylostylus longicornis]|uniref:protein windpipe n=1 Tax=Condylostylus longicornis TaxID=2530218 RepID=UPI00244DAB87|nr:protein windpipe [Condylostylus longicornis]XP_055379834.1 protein windpipe [Condylostylus longicornis]XP_055379835.1 protein windpipe [Condylostylus longicornis]